MTVEGKTIKRSRTATGKFLFSKTKPLETSDACIVHSELSADNQGVDPEKSGMAFNPGQGLKSCKRFGMIFFGIDSLACETAPQNRDVRQAWTAVVDTAITAVLNGRPGHWGVLRTGFFGVFLPGRKITDSIRLAEKISHEFNHRTGGDTLIGGVAGWPTLDYSKEDVLGNARKAYEHACFFGPGSLVPFDAVSLNISADGYYGKGEIDLAIREYEKALLLDSTNANVHNSLGVCFGVTGDLDKALACFEAASCNDPEEVIVMYNSGLIHTLKGDGDKALALFLAAGGRENDPFELLLETGKLYIERNEPELALPYLKKAVKANPQSGPAHRFLGEYHHLAGNEEDAVAIFQKAVKLNPNDANALSSLGHLFHKKGENPEIAEIFLLQSVDIIPTNGLFSERLADFYLNRGRYEEARKHFLQARANGRDGLAERIAEIEKKTGEGKCDLTKTG